MSHLRQASEHVFPLPRAPVYELLNQEHPKNTQETQIWACLFPSSSTGVGIIEQETTKEHPKNSEDLW